MQNDDKYLVLDDVVYSTQYTLLSLMCKLLLTYMENKDTELNEDDASNLKLTTKIVDLIMNDKNITKKETIFNMILSRPMQRYLVVSSEYLDWLLSKFSSLDDLDIKVSPTINLIGVPGVTVVYDDENMIEVLMLKKLGFLDKLKGNQILTLKEFKDTLNNGMTKFTNRATRPAIFTANEEILKTYSNEYAIIVPKIYLWNTGNVVCGYVENWLFENKEEAKDNKEE